MPPNGQLQLYEIVSNKFDIYFSLWQDMVAEQNPRKRKAILRKWIDARDKWILALNDFKHSLHSKLLKSKFAD